MTVAELIAALRAMPPDLEVHTEGCDCWGDIGHVKEVDAATFFTTSVRDTNDRVVLLARSYGNASNQFEVAEEVEPNA